MRLPFCNVRISLKGRTVIIGAVTTFVIQDSRDRALATEIERTQSELLGLGGQIAAIKDADLTTTNDYVAAFAQIEPIQKEYDEKVQNSAISIATPVSATAIEGYFRGCGENIIQRRGTRRRRSSDSSVKSTTLRTAKVPSSML